MKKNKGDLLFKDFNGDLTEMYFYGWQIKNIRSFIQEVLEEQVNPDERISIISINLKEIGYSTQRYFEGEDAREEGYSYWFDWRENWKKGLGKCTRVEVDWDKHDVNVAHAKSEGGEK